jgi:hypothetical protein
MDEHTDPEGPPLAPPRRGLGHDRVVIHDDFDDPLPDFDALEHSPIVPADEAEHSG